MAGPNLEVFKFGMYIMFPIATMYYFGTNLDNRFSTPDFWPRPDQTYKVPFEREEQVEELERLREKRLRLRERRLREQRGESDK
jgi:protein PET100